MSQNLLTEDLKLLDIDPSQELTSRYVTLKYKRMAKVLHPDKVGGDKCKFQELLNAYRRIIKHIEDNQKTEDDVVEDDFEKEFFMKHNIMKECTTSYVIYIEDILVEKWRKVLENHLGIQKIDNCRVIFKSVDITITLYERPKRDNRSKLHIQSRDQAKNLEFVLEKLSTFYREVCKINEVTMTSFEFKNGQRSVCEKCGKYFTNKKGVKQHMLRMHSSRKVVHKINRISVTDEESNEDNLNQLVDGEIRAVEAVDGSDFHCGECEYKSKQQEILMQHVEAVHLLPRLLSLQQIPRIQNDNVEEIISAEESLEIVVPTERESEVFKTGHVEERSCPTPVPDEIFICANCNVSFENHDKFEEHEQNTHGNIDLMGKIKNLEEALSQEKALHKNSLDEIEQLKKYVDEIEKMKGSLEVQINQLKKDLEEDVHEENKVLKTRIEEKEKLIKKNEEKHLLEINELKRQDMKMKEDLRCAINEREVLRENDRILLNTFDMMKKYMDQINVKTTKSKEGDIVNKTFKCEKCDYQANSSKLLNEHIKEIHVELEDELIEDIVYCCGKCKFESNSNATLSEHLKENHGRFPCQDCNETFESNNMLSKHMEKEHKTNICQICNFYSNNVEEMKQHVIALHNKMIKCDGCKFEATSRKALKEHMNEEHTKTNKFSCDSCRYESIIENNLLEHQKNKHDNKARLINKEKVAKPSKFDKNGKLCVFWNHGFCRHEDLCKFVHEEIPACFYQENCRREKCSFYHYNTSQNNFLGRNLKKVTTSQ